MAKEAQVTGIEEGLKASVVEVLCLVVFVAITRSAQEGIGGIINMTTFAAFWGLPVYSRLDTLIPLIFCCGMVPLLVGLSLRVAYEGMSDGPGLGIRKAGSILECIGLAFFPLTSILHLRADRLSFAANPTSSGPLDWPAAYLQLCAGTSFFFGSIAGVVSSFSLQARAARRVASILFMSGSTLALASLILLLAVEIQHTYRVSQLASSAVHHHGLTAHAPSPQEDPVSLIPPNTLTSLRAASLRALHTLEETVEVVERPILGLLHQRLGGGKRGKDDANLPPTSTGSPRITILPVTATAVFRSLFEPQHDIDENDEAKLVQTFPVTLTFFVASSCFFAGSILNVRAVGVTLPSAILYLVGTVVYTFGLMSLVWLGLRRIAQRRRGRREHLLAHTVGLAVHLHRKKMDACRSLGDDSSHGNL